MDKRLFCIESVAARRAACSRGNHRGSVGDVIIRPVPAGARSENGIPDVVERQQGKEVQDER